MTGKLIHFSVLLNTIIILKKYILIPYIFIILTSCSAQKVNIEKCYKFGSKSGKIKTSNHFCKGFNIGFRVNNFVLFDIHHKELDSYRKLYYKRFFPRLDGIHLFYVVKKNQYSHISHPKDHLIFITKNRGTITYDSKNKSDLNGVGVPSKHKYPLIIVIPIEIIFIVTNIDNWFIEK